MNNLTNDNELIVSLDNEVIVEAAESFSAAANASSHLFYELRKEGNRLEKEGNHTAATRCFEQQVRFLSLYELLRRMAQAAQKDLQES
ncbi:hypothetical protein PG2029B_1711 [Bifidobacterium pseudolongum subsp. globosum]|uniref:Uncharacterized protein n=1 Tax=Bifidobacterium pseudolongum subsp. globosum TaxID=1690 RepID=A0A4Q5AB15_9BIFI|nr:hypothetical protein [Bifidobacterium pseudolongum]RYQ23578.1 hypothetical protein PG2032B_1711 [Bifidobacterium pseudolongum subsp. globosum]RYQ25219.1 hypothetical protein PG2029B_1711 [Bifidobacterium pseudolongum subsp. globosum]